MAFLEILRVALGALRATKLRSLLTMLGIVIGVAAVMTMVALGSGAQRAVEAQLDAMGTDLLSIYPGRGGRWWGASDTRVPLTVDDVDALRAKTKTLKAVVPTLGGRVDAEYGTGSTNANVVATTANFAEVNRFSLEFGTFFTDADDLARRRVAVLGYEVPEELGVPAAELLGRDISLRGVRFLVIGILVRKGEQPGPDPDDSIYIPFRTGQYRLFGTDHLQSIAVQVVRRDSIALAMLEIEGALRSQHRLRPDEDNDFRLIDRTQFLEARADASATLTFLLAGIAAVSLLVGGIGIMNIMLVSVTERTREIGIRMAIGATRRSVLLQFLTEALVLCALGGLIGILTGAAAAWVISYTRGWDTVVSPEAVALAVGFSFAIGIFFGVWPARRAAQLDPIEALRYE